MNYTIEQVAKVNTVYFRRTGAYDGESNKQLMDQLKSWAEDHQLLADATILGIPQDDPATTAKEACRYDVCLVVEDNVRVELPAQTGFFLKEEHSLFFNSIIRNKLYPLFGITLTK